MNLIQYKILDLVRLNETDIDLIRSLNSSDKMIIIETYISTMNHIIEFMENYL